MVRCEYKRSKDICPTYYAFSKYMSEVLVDIREEQSRNHGKEISDIVIEINSKR